MKNIKEKVKAKVAKAKEKVKAKVGKCAKCAVILAAFAAVAGCMGTNPASRATSSADKVGDFDFRMQGCSNCHFAVNFTKGDSALASADSSGSTETQTASPTQSTDVSPKTDVNTTGGRTAGVLETALSAGAAALLSPGGKASAASAACPDGNCSYGGTCADGSCTDGSCSTCRE